MLKLLKRNIILVTFISIILGIIGFSLWSHLDLKQDVVSTNSRVNTVEDEVNNLKVNGGDTLVGASTLFAQNASVQLNLEVLGTYASTSGNLSFNGEIMPDGATCSNNQILKRTGANDWDCAADASGSVSSNSLDFDEFVASMSLDTFTDVTFGTQQYSFNLNSTGDFVIEDNGAIHTIFTDTGNVGIGTRTPQAELQINSSGTSSLYLSQDSVAHGMTSIAPANTFGVFQNNSLTDGILDIIGISDANNEALRLNGVIGNTNPTDTTCAVCIIGSKENGGTGNQALGSLETVFGVSNYISTRLFSILGRGFTGVLTNTPTTVFEVQGTASASYFLTGNTLQVGGFSSAAYSRFGTDVTTNSNYISTTNDVLVSGDLQVIGTGSFNYASTSLGYFGGGLTDCDGGTSKLLWSDTGLFSCGTDDDVPESGDFTNLTGGLAIDNNAGTLDFDSTEFTGNRSWSDGTSDSTFTWTFDLNAGTDIGINFGDNRLLISQNVSTSSNFEAVGYASASKYFGVALSNLGGTTGCAGANDTLNYNSTTGIFSCGSDGGGSAVTSNSLDWDEFVPSMSLDTNTSIASQSFTLNWGATFFKAIGEVTSRFVKATLKLILPTRTASNVNETGAIAVGTGSGSLNFHDGTAERILKSEYCFGFYIEDPTAANDRWIGHKRFNDPFTITSIQPVASGTNSAGWNLYYGPAGSNTTTVFSVNKSASTSTYPTYTSFSNSLILNNHVLDVVITSTSLKIQSFTVNICGRDS